MPPKGEDLQNPWVRAQLVEWLVRLSDKSWQAENWTPDREGAFDLDEALDFFDDSGVLAEPEGRLGFVLVDDVEVEAMQALNYVLDRVLPQLPSDDTRIIQTQAWSDVVEAAREALAALAVHPQ